MITLPIRLRDGLLTGATWPEIERFYPGDQVRQIERASIRAFMEKHRGYLKGRVLDFGAGKPGTCLQPEPYRDLVEGIYIPVDKGYNFDEESKFGSVICTQVLQYLEFPEDPITLFSYSLVPGGNLILTYPTNWDEVEMSELWRFTKSGMEQILRTHGFEILHHERRAEIWTNQFCFPLGYGCIAQKRH